ncbi:MAG: hypothetical protein QXF26_00385 [Candidatus Bathyarchaeia archaeon]
MQKRVIDILLDFTPIHRIINFIRVVSSVYKDRLAINLDALVMHVVLNVIVISPVLWLSGRALVGKQKAKFTDAVLIVILGTIIGVILGNFFTGIIASIVQLVVWLALVKHFFDCGWLMALAISIIAIIIFAVIAVVLGLLGFMLIRFI